MHPADAQYRATRADWAHAALVAAALFVLYAATSPRTVSSEDDGLFILAAYFLGAAHPPGYPLLVLIGKVFTLLPVGSVAYRVHLVSAFFGGLSCAVLWFCARAMIAGRLPAYLAAFALGLSPVFWSQSVIAEVYTLNTFLFLTLVLLGLRACPPLAPQAGDARALPWIAFLYGLSLSNHWPLMGLLTPALAVLLWPRRMEILRRLPLLAGLAALGLSPYVWMVVASWQWQPIAYNGPLQTLAEVWHTLSRAGYASTDNSVSAGWLDRIQFFQFQVVQLLVQFAVLGTLLAAAGAAAQRRVLGGRVALALTVAFLMPTFVLLLMLNFDYDAVNKHIFHVYPLPAYAMAALWMGLGFERLRERWRLQPRAAAAAAAALLALSAGAGVWTNLGDDTWGVRYAHAVMKVLPKDAVLFVRSDFDLAPIAYFYLVENQRPDIEIYHIAGRVLGNRLYHPLRTSPEQAYQLLGKFIDGKKETVAFTFDQYSGYARRDHWLYIEVDKSSRDGNQVTVDIPEDALRFFEEAVASGRDANAWIAFHQDELRRRYGTLLGRVLPRGELDARTRKHLELLSGDGYGALGLAEGLMSNPKGYSAGVVEDLLQRARDKMPSDAVKSHKARYFYLRGALRLDVGDRPGALADFETALDVYPRADNEAIKPLTDFYRQSGNTQALQAMEARVRGRR